MGSDSLIASLNGTLNVYNTKTSLISAKKNPLNQQKYICGESNVAKLINELTEQIVSFIQIMPISIILTLFFMLLYGCRIDQFEGEKRNSSYKISLISPKATIYLNDENFNIVTKILVEQLIVI